MENIGMKRVFGHQSKTKRGVILILLAAVVTLACTCGNYMPTSITNIFVKETASSGDVSTNILLQDDFSDPNSGWEVAQYEAGETGYTNGAYFVTSTVENKAMWGLAGKDFSDVSIEVTATQISGPSNNNNDYGIMCRMTDTSGYSFNISGDGFYSIQIMQNDAFTNLIDWTSSDKINTGNATNTIKVVCQGSTLTFYVNGNELVEASDDTYTSGDIALTTTTYETEASEIHFDNLVVTTP